VLVPAEKAKGTQRKKLTAAQAANDRCFFKGANLVCGPGASDRKLPGYEKAQVNFPVEFLGGYVILLFGGFFSLGGKTRHRVTEETRGRHDGSNEHLVE
jgi:hypothetical protein